MRIVTLYTIVRKWNQPRCPSTEMQDLYKMEFVARKIESTRLAHKWVEMKQIIVSEVIQAHKGKLCQFLCFKTGRCPVNGSASNNDTEKKKKYAIYFLLTVVTVVASYVIGFQHSLPDVHYISD